MIVYGFLSYENGEVRIPNKELMNKFDDMIQADFGVKSRSYTRRSPRTDKK